MSLAPVQRLRHLVDQLPPIPAPPEQSQPVGRWQTALAPATLDLAQRAALAVNVLTATVRPDDGYAVTQTFRFDRQPPWLGPPNWMPMKFVRALPLMRAMCGSAANLAVEWATMTAILRRVGNDGQVYTPIAGDGPPTGTSYPVMNGIVALALLTWYGRDQNPHWLAWLRLVVEGLKDSLIEVADYAYIPPECSLSADGQWHWTLRGNRQWPPGYTPYTPPAEPVSDQQGFEGAVKWEQSNVLKALVAAYHCFGDEDALTRAHKLANFCLKANLWEERDGNGHPGVEHGLWAGHVHGNLNTLQALLELALATNDSRLKQIVRQGYEYLRLHGCIRLGWMPSWIAPQRFGRPVSAAVESEGCGIADTLLLAIQLSDAGLGDYWDDVDATVRNHLLEMQMVDLAAMRGACGTGAYDATLQQFIGGFTQAELTANRHGSVHGCCTGNGTRALYHAWEGITRFDQGVATVNLLLNRASPWLDVDSYLPYRGQVVLHNKLAHTLLIRLPYWVERQKLTCVSNDRAMASTLVGNHLLLQGLQPGDRVQITFPLTEVTERYTIGDTLYTATVRGSTVVDIQPRATDQAGEQNAYPFFVREHLRNTTAPMHLVQRFIADSLNMRV
jgi:hypothetical protein